MTPAGHRWALDRSGGGEATSQRFYLFIFISFFLTILRAEASFIFRVSSMFNFGEGDSGNISRVPSERPRRAPRDATHRVAAGRGREGRDHAFHWLGPGAWPAFFNPIGQWESPDPPAGSPGSTRNCRRHHLAAARAAVGGACAGASGLERDHYLAGPGGCSLVPILDPPASHTPPRWGPRTPRRRG